MMTFIVVGNGDICGRTKCRCLRLTILLLQVTQQITPINYLPQQIHHRHKMMLTLSLCYGHCPQQHTWLSQCFYGHFKHYFKIFLFPQCTRDFNAAL